MARVMTKGAVLAPGVVARTDRRGVTARSDKAQGVISPTEPDGAVTLSPERADIDTLRKKLRDYVDLKSEEIEERRVASSYYHTNGQWSEKERQALKERGQPEITYNRIARKINGVVGLLERLRQDPKAYPRTSAHESGADVATQCVRYGLDASQWDAKLSDVSLDLALAGIGGWELGLEPADDNSSDPMWDRVPPETFFYDPRSLRHDFSDARFMGVAKWMDKAEAIAFMPDAREEIENSVSTLSTSAYAEELDPDTQHLWWDGSQKKIRVVETWYREGDRWFWAIHTGIEVLSEGESPFTKRGKSACRFVMQSANVDERGVRYGFVRNLKGAQDEINHRRSRALHAFNTKQVIVEEGIVSDPDRLRREAHRIDGVVSLDPGSSGKIRIENNTDIAVANVQMLQEAKEEIENFGPNPALIGQGLDNKSGRAIALLQQAAIAELGPFIVRVRSMKIRCYELMWEAIQANWTQAREIRLTDDEGNPGFLPINQPVTDEYGMPTGQVENPIGKLMVDFVLDEGPDTVTLREDAQQAIGQAMSAGGQAIPPQVMVQLSRALMSNMNLSPSDKKRIMDAYDQMEQAGQQPPAPEEQAAVELELRNKAATAADREASALHKTEQARQLGMQNSANALAAEIAAQGYANMVPGY